MAAVRLVAGRADVERARHREAAARLRAAQRARAALWRQVAAGLHPGDEHARDVALRAADDAVAWAGLDVARLGDVR